MSEQNQLLAKTIQVGQYLQFAPKDGHPLSKIIKIDSYELAAEDGQTRTRKSYTLIPEKEEERVEPYRRWYLVDLPHIGFAFDQAIEPEELPDNLIEEPKLSGTTTMFGDGDALLNTDQSTIKSYWDNSTTPPTSYGIETISISNLEEEDTLYVRATPITGRVTVLNSI